MIASSWCIDYDLFLSEIGIWLFQPSVVVTTKKQFRGDHVSRCDMPVGYTRDCCVRWLLTFCLLQSDHAGSPAYCQGLCKERLAWVINSPVEYSLAQGTAGL